MNKQSESAESEIPVKLEIPDDGKSELILSFISVTFTTNIIEGALQVVEQIIR